MKRLFLINIICTLVTSFHTSIISSKSNDIEYQTIWEQNILIDETTKSMFKPEIIQYDGRIYANYGDMVYVFSFETGIILNHYTPFIEGMHYTLLNIKIDHDAIYAVAKKSHSISN